MSALNGLSCVIFVTNEIKTKIFKNIVGSITTFGSDVSILKCQLQAKLLAEGMEFWGAFCKDIEGRKKIWNKPITEKKWGLKFQFWTS